MLQSLERGRRAEIEFMNGYVVGRGMEVGVPTPVNARLVKLVREIESGTRLIDQENIEVLLKPRQLL